MASFADRLKRIKARGGAQATRAQGGDPAIPGPPGWEEAAPGVYLREKRYPGPLFEAETWIDIDGKRPIEALAPGGGRVESPRLRVLDLETTGLSGVAGTVAFLAGIGRMEGPAFLLTQVFLSDYPYEGPFLDLIAGLLGKGALMVSYNGRAFDSKLLDARFRMNGLRPPPYGQLDLLHVARRIYGPSLPDLSLKTVEAELLGVARGLDIDGALIPERYHEYLRERDPLLLEEIFEHHLQDILSTASLYLLLAELHDPLRAPAKPAGLACPSGLGKNLLGLGRREEALASFLAGREAGGEEAARCLKLLAQAYRSEGRFAEEGGARKELWELTRELDAGRRYAMWLEHRARDYAAALGLVGEMRKKWKSDEDLEKRAARLERKMGR